MDDNDSTTTRTNNKPASAYAKVGDFEYKFEGSEEFVQHNIDTYGAAIVQIGATVLKESRKSRKRLNQSNGDVQQLPLFDSIEEDGTSTLEVVDDVPSQELGYQNGNSSYQDNEIPDLHTLYRKMAPSNQWEAILLISYHHEFKLGQESVTLQEYEVAFDQLQRVGAELPGRVRDSARAAVDKKYLYRPGQRQGEFRLTEDGIKSVQSRI